MQQRTPLPRESPDMTLDRRGSHLSSGDEQEDATDRKKSSKAQQQQHQLGSTHQWLLLHKCRTLNAKTILSSAIFSFLCCLVFDSLWNPPEKRLFRPDLSDQFLQWVQHHPAQGLLWILLAMSISVVCMIPIGTPLTLGCGYVYKGAYGWWWGVSIATGVSMVGSAVGAVVCFGLGRTLLRDFVRRTWLRQYPLFEAIDVAAAQHGLRIMAMLYLTPVLPLGPVAYMCGTTRMALHHFVMAKIAALPLMLLYVFIGASAGTLMGKNGKSGAAASFSSEVKSIEENETLIVSGIVLSFVSIACITHYIRQELNKILEEQKKQMEGATTASGDEEEGTLELSASRAPTRRQRKH